MTSISDQFLYAFKEGEGRGNLMALLRYLGFLVAVIAFYAVIFQLIMVQVEGQDHSWITAIYWTVVTMSTLGFGDVVFNTDLGRLFSLLVLMSGILLLLVLLPFTFIRFFYAPWLEAQVRFRAPRKVPVKTRGHVIICRYDSIATGLIERFQEEKIPYYVVEPGPVEAGHLLDKGVSVVLGDRDSRKTYEELQVHQARLLLANCEDTTNTNIALTVRETYQDVPMVAVVDQEDSSDILELSGCTHVLPLKVHLGQYLAKRASFGLGKVDVVGGFKELKIAEISVRNTVFADISVANTRLRERTGVNIVGLWKGGQLTPALSNTMLDSDSIIIVVGKADQLQKVDELLSRDLSGGNQAVLVIGAGKVGRITVRELKRQGLSVHVLDRNPEVEAKLDGLADDFFCGDANDRKVLEMAGLNDVSAVVLTTHDDAVNVYLSVYCRRLRPELRIASRITHDRNVEAIHRAGADFSISYAYLGVEAVMSLIEGRDIVVLGEGIDLFEVVAPASLVNKTLAQTDIRSRSGLSVIAVEQGDELIESPSASLKLPAECKLVMLGSLEQRKMFSEIFE